MDRRVCLDAFAPGAVLPFNTLLRGGGAIEATGNFLRLSNTAAAGRYTNAQLDDYQTLPRRRFLWRPPLKLTVRARFSHPDGQLSGTAGFGFWNDPFMMTGLRPPTLPRAAWFFYASPPSNMKLALNTPGWGFKAAILDALRPAFLALLPLAPLAIPLMNFPALYRHCWPIGQRAINVSEAAISRPMTNWHTYTLLWLKNSVRFSVDEEPILACSAAPRGPLGFVLWLDNQFMVATPWGKLRHGLLASAGRQWLDIAGLSIEPVAGLPEKE